MRDTFGEITQRNRFGETPHPSDANRMSGLGVVDRRQRPLIE